MARPFPSGPGPHDRAPEPDGIPARAGLCGQVRRGGRPAQQGHGGFPPHQRRADQGKQREIADRVVLLADDSKFGRTAPVLLCPLSRAGVLVTNRSPPRDFLHALDGHRVQVEVAE